jgi:hypothetical protein
VTGSVLDTAAGAFVILGGVLVSTVAAARGAVVRLELREDEIVIVNRWRVIRYPRVAGLDLVPVTPWWALLVRGFASIGFLAVSCPGRRSVVALAALGRSAKSVDIQPLLRSLKADDAGGEVTMPKS